MSNIKNTKPKIAIITIKNSYSYGGVFAKLKIVHDFCTKYFEPTVFCLSFDKDISASIRSFRFFSKTKEEKFFDIKYVHIGAKWAFWEAGHYKFTKSLWQQELKNYDYFWVVSGNPIPAYPLVKLNKKFVMWVASDYLQDRQERIKELSFFRYFLHKLNVCKILNMEREILRKANFIWTLSKYTHKRFEQILGDQRENMFICNYPMQVPEDVLTNKISNIKNNLSKTKIIIAVGRFNDPRKNIAMLIRVFNRIYRFIPDVKLYVIGSKPKDKDLTNFLDFPCFKNIIFTGQISDQELQNYYKIADLLLLTSYQEGLGIVGLQALCYGIPVISTDCGGPRDFIVHAKNGYLVEINDDQDMADKALNLLQSDVLYQDFSNFAIEFIKDNFSIKKIENLFKFGLTTTYPELKELFDESSSNWTRIYSQNQQTQMENFSE
ncbi:MAG: glycosyltransferase [Candidatus Babeliales bacterium]